MFGVIWLSIIWMLVLSSRWWLALAAYPDHELIWSTESCPKGYDYCGTLEFCKDGYSTFSYRLPSSNECNGPATPGPLIRLVSGKKYYFTLRNVVDDPYTITNIHTHGLHIVGSGNSDDVLRQVSGGHCLDYSWDIAADHPGGTYWYHAHHHKFTEQQVAGGAFGLLVVEDSL